MKSYKVEKEEKTVEWTNREHNKVGDFNPNVLAFTLQVNCWKTDITKGVPNIKTCNILYAKIIF